MVSTAGQQLTLHFVGGISLTLISLKTFAENIIDRHSVFLKNYLVVKIQIKIYFVHIITTGF